MNPFVMLGLFSGGIVFIGWFAYRRGKLAADNLRQIAGKLGLDFTVRPPVMGLFYTAMRATGQRRGRRMEIFPFTTGSGKSRESWCAVTVAVAESGLTFHLRQEGFGLKLMTVFGAKEIQVGDAEFDREWFIQTNEPEFFAAALLPEVRAKFMALPQVPGLEFKLESGMVRYTDQMARFSDTSSCQRCIQAADIVCDLADLAEVFAEQKAGS